MSEYTTGEILILLRRLLYYAEDKLNSVDADEFPDEMIRIQSSIRWAKIKIEEMEDSYE